MNIGLNGVPITESVSRRTVSLYAEPRVEPNERPLSAVGKVEAAGTDHPAPPITLVVSPVPDQPIDRPGDGRESAPTSLALEAAILSPRTIG